MTLTRRRRSSATVKALDGGDSARKKCENNRIVRVKRVQPGEDPTFGTTKTDKDGNWAIAGSRAYEEGGQY